MIVRNAGGVMFTVGFGPYQLHCVYGDGLPYTLAEYVSHAALAEQIDLSNPEGKFCFVALKRVVDVWPSLVIAKRYQPAENAFFPGVLLVPETNRLFVGAGTRLLCYDIAKPARLWEDAAEFGFWSWTQDGAEVFMAAELEFAAFDTSGKKLWTRAVEPPWQFKLEPNRITLDIMGSITHLDRRTGQPV
jgi:hypothetical protein